MVRSSGSGFAAAQPGVLARLGGRAVAARQHLDSLDLAAVDHLETVGETPVGGVVLRHLLVDVAVGGQFVWRRHVRHFGLVLQAALLDLEGRGHVEDRLSVLDADDAPGGEALAVPDAVDVEQDRSLGVAAAQEVGVDRVQVAVLDRRRRGDRPPKPPRPAPWCVVGAPPGPHRASCPSRRRLAPLRRRR